MTGAHQEVLFGRRFDNRAGQAKDRHHGIVLVLLRIGRSGRDGRGDDQAGDGRQR